MTFDGPNKLVILSSSTLDLQALWSAWKVWLRAGNAQYALAMNTVGGEPIDPSAGTLVPLYLFLLNGWKLRPMEADHTLSVAGGTLLVEGGGDPFVSTIGDFTVRIRYQQPVQAIGYSTTGGTAGPSAADIAAAVLAALNATTGTRTVGQHLQIHTAVLVGETSGAGTSHIAFVDGSVTVEADVPTAGQTGDRKNVVIGGV